MKTTKSILVVLFALTLAQVASAYYCPSTGRWLSRDPIGEPGFQVLQATVQAPIAATSSRWIARDTVGQIKLKPIGNYPKRNSATDINTYGFVDNNPVGKVDPDGRSPIIVGGAVIGAVAACAYPQYKLAFSRYPDSGDKFKHCWVSCRISKTCGAGISQLAGIGKEARDRAVATYCDLYPDSEICQGGHGDFWDSIGDLKANQQCMGWEVSLR